MKRMTLWALAIIFIGNGIVYSQPEKKSWELSASGFLGNISDGSDGSSSQYMAIDLRTGYFVTENVEIEPDIQWVSAETDNALLSLSANVAYNFVFSTSNTMPFILIGFGRTNSIPILNTLIFQISDKHDVNIVNIGGGLKLLAAKNVMFRIEFRHQRFSYSRESFSGPIDYTIKQNNILLGFSVFFGPAEPGR